MRDLINIIDDAAQKLDEFVRTGDDGREFMGWKEFLAIWTPVMRQWHFFIKKDKYPSMLYSKKGRQAGEFYVILVEPSGNRVQYVFGVVNDSSPDIEEEGYVTMDRPGAQELHDKAEAHYSILDQLDRRI